MIDRPFNGRLFGPGLPGTGCTATGQWGERGELIVTTDGDDRAEFLADNPTVDAGGFNAASIRISWQQNDDTYVFSVDTDNDLKACIAGAPPVRAPHLSAAAGERNRVERRFRIGGVLIGLFFTLPFLAIVVFFLNSDSVAEWAVTRIPKEQESKIGDLVLTQTRLQMKIIDRGPAVDAISTIGSRLAAGSAYHYRWFVADTPEVNAFAAPGGVVIVFSGLIRSAGSAEELAGVLAHEIAHAELRHSLRGLVKSLGLRALAGLIVGDVSGNAFAEAATRLTELRFSREAEQEADKDGLRRLVTARVDPNGMIRFYEKIAVDKRPLPPPILSTHPATGERLVWLRQEVAGLKKSWKPLDVDLERARNSLP